MEAESFQISTNQCRLRQWGFQQGYDELETRSPSYHYNIAQIFPILLQFLEGEYRNEWIFYQSSGRGSWT